MAAANRLQIITAHLQPSPSTRPQPCSGMSKSPKSPITSHVLDTALGQPAAGVPVQLSYLEPTTQSWMTIVQASTNSDGRVTHLLTQDQLRAGTYKMHFDTATYFASLGNHKPFYPYADVVFTLEDTSQHYHIPLLLSPYAYSTYRGS